MKRTLLTVLILTATLSLLTVSCSSNNDDGNNGTQQTNPATIQHFHPPTWIQGTWGVTNGTTTNKLYKFTADDFILLVTGVSEQSMTGTIKSTPNGGNVDETINQTQYNFTVKYNITTTTQSFEFRKVSATQIQWKSNGTWVDLVKL